MTAFSSAGISGIGARTDFHAAVAPFPDHDVDLAERGVFLGIVLAEMAATAFAPLDGASA